MNGMRRSGAPGGHRRAIRKFAAVWFVALSAIVLLASCSRSDVEQVRLCQSIIPALENTDSTVTFGAATVPENETYAVRIAYTTGDDPDPHWIICRFTGGRLSSQRLGLIGVETDRAGKLSDVKLHILRRFWLGSFQLRHQESAASGGDFSSRIGAYTLQQTINASVVGCVYALLAIAYTLVFGILSRINLAFGDLTMLGGFTTLAGVQLAASMGATSIALVLLALLVLSAIATAAWGSATERLVFRPLRQARGQSALIVTIGLAIAIRELIRLQHGAGERWLQPVLSDTIVLLTQAGFTVTITPFQILIVSATVLLYVGHTRLAERRSFGFRWRACAQDRFMAALCGVDVNRVVATTFVVAGAYAGLAGWTIAMNYGSVSFYMGAVLGFKALTAAVIGGIGSVSGAFIGGLALGLAETMWSAFLPADYRDVFVFALLAATLIFRPNGLLNKPTPESATGVGESKHSN